MNVSLNPTLEKMLQEKVASGLYNSVSEVIREALRLLVEREKMQQAKLEALREDIDIGIKELDSGQAIKYDVDSVSNILKEVQSRKK